jgi:hypothetical protein
MAENLGIPKEDRIPKPLNSRNLDRDFDIFFTKISQLIDKIAMREDMRLENEDLNECMLRSLQPSRIIKQVDDYIHHNKITKYNLKITHEIMWHIVKRYYIICFVLRVLQSLLNYSGIFFLDCLQNELKLQAPTSASSNSSHLSGSNSRLLGVEMAIVYMFIMCLNFYMQSIFSNKYSWFLQKMRNMQ